MSDLLFVGVPIGFLSYKKTTETLSAIRYGALLDGRNCGESRPGTMKTAPC
jgi:hypothetical protein